MKSITANRKGLCSSKKSEILFAYVLLIPALLILSIVMFYPILKGIVMSFYDYTFFTMHNPKWNNFANYAKIFKDGILFRNLTNTLIYVIGSVSLQLIIALPLALLLNSDIRGRNFFRGAFLMSWTVPTLVTSLIWALLFQPQYGLWNYIMYSFGLISDSNMQWLQSPQLAKVTIIIATVWRQTPYMLIMILAGLQSVKKDLLEAASLDGANSIQVFKNVILPSISTVLGTTVLIAVLDAFQQFTIIYNMTAGGPMNSTTTLSIAAYKEAFINHDIGAGSAIGVIWLVLLATITCIFNIKAKRFEE
ncbi:MAG: carbohydrate ABC transporter permease [Acetivibrionales bacterium]|jgi:multiple sugar transport system permease protein